MQACTCQISRPSLVGVNTWICSVSGACSSMATIDSAPVSSLAHACTGQSRCQGMRFCT